MAVFVADVIAHIAVHGALPTASEFRHMARVSTESLGVLVLPVFFLTVAGSGRWQLHTALRASTLALTASLVVIGYLAARRLSLPTSQRLVVLFAEFGLGVLVIAIELPVRLRL